MLLNEKINKLNSLNEFINGDLQDDLLFYLKSNFKDDKWSIICSVMHSFGVVQSYLDYDMILKNDTPDYN